MLQQIGFLWAVTGVVWLGTAFYTISLLKRQSRLQRELQQLEKTLDELQRNMGRG
jgi:CcmD family protein